MNITLKTSEVLEKYNAIEEFIKKDISIPIQFAWNIEDNQEKFKVIVERFEKHRQELLKPLQEKGAFQSTEDGKTIIKNEYINDFQDINNKLNEYLNTDNELNIKTAKREDMPNIISPKDLRAVRFMLED